jgi:DNA-binding NarL/FixJ family response regulator
VKVTNEAGRPTTKMATVSMVALPRCTPDRLTATGSNEAVAAAPCGGLTARELQVLELMAEGRSNAGIMAALKVSPSAVEKYVTNIFLKLDLPAAGSDHRRVLAVLKYLGTL